MKRQSAGFTLIELLVVLAIIGILAGIGVIGIPSQRARSRNAQRLADVKKIQLAMERYYAHNGKYPFPDMPSCRSGAVYSCEINGIDHGPNGGDNPNPDCQVPYEQSFASLFSDYLKPYVDALPNDPLVATSENSHYTVIVGGPDDNHQHYLITANLEGSGAQKFIQSNGAIYGAESVHVVSRYMSQAGSTTSEVYHQTVAVFRSWDTTGDPPARTCETDILASPADGLDILCGKTNSQNGPYKHFNVLCVGNIAGAGYWSGRDVLEKRANGAFTAP